MGCGAVAEQMEAQILDMERLVNILCQENYNRQGANLRKYTSSPLPGIFSFHDGTGKIVTYFSGTTEQYMVFAQRKMFKIDKL